MAQQRAIGAPEAVVIFHDGDVRKGIAIRLAPERALVASRRSERGAQRAMSLNRAAAACESSHLAIPPLQPFSSLTAPVERGHPRWARVVEAKMVALLQIEAGIHRQSDAGDAPGR